METSMEYGNYIDLFPLDVTTTQSGLGLCAVRDSVSMVFRHSRACRSTQKKQQKRQYVVP